MAIRPTTHLTNPLWDQQPGESRTAYARFRTYLAQPSTDRHYRRNTGRSLERAATYNRVSDRTITETAHKHAWETRAAAWDEHALHQHHNALATARLNAAHELIDALRTGIAHHNTPGPGGPTAAELATLATAVDTLHTPVPRPPSPHPTTTNTNGDDTTGQAP